MGLVGAVRQSRDKRWERNFFAAIPIGKSGIAVHPMPHGDGDGGGLGLGLNYRF